MCDNGCANHWTGTFCESMVHYFIKYLSTVAIITLNVCYVVFFGNYLRNPVHIDSDIEKSKPIGTFLQRSKQGIEQTKKDYFLDKCLIVYLFNYFLFLFLSFLLSLYLFGCISTINSITCICFSLLRSLLRH